MREKEDNVILSNVTPADNASHARPLRVAYDTSVLGYAQYGAAGRSGVFRITESLAVALARMPDCELSFCGAENFRAWVAAQEYLNSQPELCAVPRLSFAPSARVYRFLGKWFWELAEQQRLPLPQRAIRRALAQTLRQIDRHYPALNPIALEGHDVFHSSYYAIPDSIRGIRGLSRFQTVCDLAPILFPQYHPDGAPHFRSLVDSLTPQDWVICISQNTRSDLLNYRPDLDPQKLQVVPLAPAPCFAPVTDPAKKQWIRERLGVGAAPFVLSVCTLDRRKNLVSLLRAFAGLGPAGEEVRLVLVGARGTEAQAIEKAIGELGFRKGQVSTVGYLEDWELAAAYSQCEVFVYPSLYEGFGLPVLEAMACGAPTVTSNRSSLPEVAGEAAWLVDPQDPEALTEALRVVLTDAACAENLREKALERAQGFSWEKSARALMRAYHTARAAAGE